MRRMMMAGLAAAAVFCAALPQGQAADGAAMTTVEMRGLSETYTKSAEPPVEDVSEDAVPRLFPLLRVEDYPGALRADGRVIAWVSHPEISVVGDDYPVLARVLRNWSNAQRQHANGCHPVPTIRTRSSSAGGEPTSEWSALPCAMRNTAEARIHSTGL